MRAPAVLALLALATFGGDTGAGPTLAVRVPGGWETWWRSESAPVALARPAPALADRVRWRRAARGLEWAQFSLAGDGEAFRVRVILARLDPGALELV